MQTNGFVNSKRPLRKIFDYAEIGAMLEVLSDVAWAMGSTDTTDAQRQRLVNGIRDAEAVLEKVLRDCNL